MPKKPEFSALVESAKGKAAAPDRQARIAEMDALVAREAEAASRFGIEAHARKVAAEVRGEIAPGGAIVPEQGWLSFAPMPSDLCRVSPFSPMGKTALASRPFVEDLVIVKSAWGELRYTGPRLSIFEEDVFLALLALIEEPGEGTEVELMGKPTVTWIGPIRRLLSLMGLTDGAANYSRVRRALKLMRATTFELALKSGRVNGCGLLGGYDLDPKTGQDRVTVDPVFYELYSRGSVTRLDVERRAKLPGAVAKCLYRFIMSHKGPKWSGHWMTVARAINLDMDQPDKKLRQMLRGGIAALVKSGVLTKASALEKETLTMVRGRP